MNLINCISEKIKIEERFGLQARREKSSCLARNAAISKSDQRLSCPIAASDAAQLAAASRKLQKFMAKQIAVVIAVDYNRHT